MPGRQQAVAVQGSDGSFCQGLRLAGDESVRRNWPGCRAHCTRNSVIQKRADGGAVAEPDFGFSRVDVDVDERRIKAQHQDKTGLTVAMQGLAKGLPHGKAERTVAYTAPVDE